MQYKNFTEKTGIKVNVVKSNADELIERLKNEGENSPADLFVTVDAGKLYNARESGVLQKVPSDAINENIRYDVLISLIFSVNLFFMFFFILVIFSIYRYKTNCFNYY